MRRAPDPTTRYDVQCDIIISVPKLRFSVASGITYVNSAPDCHELTLIKYNNLVKNSCLIEVDLGDWNVLLGISTNMVLYISINLNPFNSVRLFDYTIHKSLCKWRLYYLNYVYIFWRNHHMYSTDFKSHIFQLDTEYVILLIMSFFSNLYARYYIWFTILYYQMVAN